MVVKRLQLIAWLLMIPILMQAVTVSSGVNKNTLSLADQLIYTIKITDSSRISVSEPAPPKIPGFTFRNMTSGSSNMVSINGLKSVSEHSQTYDYYYTPQKTGSTTINPVEIKIGNRFYRTQTHQITVVPGAKSAPAQPAPAFPFAFPFDYDQQSPWDDPQAMGSNTFLMAVPETQTVYRGYPAIVSYYLYTDEIVRSFNLEEEHDSPGYGKTTYEQPSMLNYEDVRYNGKSYKRALIKRLVIIPNRDGELQAPQLEGVARLYSFGYMNKSLRSTGGQILVRPLPRESAPQDFGGAVGNFEISSSLSKHQVALGEAITLTLKISGKGNFNQFTAPEFNSGKGFRISKPMLADNLTAGIEGTRICYYTIIPQNKGELSLPELKFTWFAHDKGSFNTWKLPPAVIKVTGAHVLSYLNRMLEPGTPRSMYPKLSKRSYPPYVSLPGSIWYWLAMGAILVLSATESYLVVTRKHQRLHPDSYARKNADRILSKYMKHATRAGENQSPDFYPLAETALWNYLNTKYKLPNRLSTAEKISRLQDYGFTAELLHDLGEFFAHCTVARYMPPNDLAVNIIRDVELLQSLVDKLSRGNKLNPREVDGEA